MNGNVTFIELARIFDARERPLEAAWAYEIALAQGDMELDLVLDLAVLYFVCLDFGYATRHNLPEEFVSGAWTRAFQVLEVGNDRFGANTDLEFWKCYFSSVYVRDEGIEDLSARLLHNSDSLLPAAYLFLAGEKEFEGQALELLESVKNGSTERERYIKSILEAELARVTDN